MFRAQEQKKMRVVETYMRRCQALLVQSWSFCRPSELHSVQIVLDCSTVVSRTAGKDLYIFDPEAKGI